MVFKKNQNVLISFSNALRAFSLTEALLAAVLVGIVSALALSALNVSGQIQGIQSNKIVQAAMMEIQASVTKYKQRNGMIDATTPFNQTLALIDATEITTNLSIDGDSTTSTPYTCNTSSYVCKRLKTGAIIAYWSTPTFLWNNTAIYTPRNIRVSGIIIDPDGVDSSATNDAGQSTKLLMTMNGHFLSSTEWQWDNVLDPISNTPVWNGVVQPRYFRLDK
jgi:type II secretory pathway pseudopilin PulG